MKINFDKLRIQLIDSYDDLVNRLNKSISEDKIIINVRDLKQQMDSLRYYLVLIGCLIGENENIKPVLKHRIIKEFNSK